MFQGLGGVKMWNLENLPDFDFVAAGGICDRVSQTHFDCQFSGLEGKVMGKYEAVKEYIIHFPCL